MRKLDMAWINGNIYTADDKFSTVAAFRVSGDRFSVVGSTEEVLENCDEHEDHRSSGKNSTAWIDRCPSSHYQYRCYEAEPESGIETKQEILDMVADAYSSAKKESGSLDGDGSMIHG